MGALVLEQYGVTAKIVGEIYLVPGKRDGVKGCLYKEQPQNPKCKPCVASQRCKRAGKVTAKHPATKKQYTTMKRHNGDMSTSMEIASNQAACTKLPKDRTHIGMCMIRTIRHKRNKT